MNWTKLIFFLFLTGIIVLTLAFYSWIFSYLLLSMVLAYILDPLVTWFEMRAIARWLSVVLVYLIVGGLIAWFTAMYVPQLIDQGNNFFQMISSSEQSGGEYFVTLPFFRTIHVFLQTLDARIPGIAVSGQFIKFLDGMKERLAQLPILLIDNYQTILGTISYLATIPLISFFLLKDKNSLRKSFIKLAPNRYFELFLMILAKVDESVGRFLRAMLFEVIAVGIMVSLALSFLGISNAVLIGITAGVANIIPYFGPLIGVAIAVLTIIVESGDPIMILWVVLAMYGVQAFDNNIVYPVVVGKTIDMHPLLVLLTVLAGGWFGGIIWMLISVPLVYIVYSLVKVLYVNLKQFRLI
ncbi:MAG: AI-2E family transporter [Candidatus Cloacimonadaceae bacterium]|nr:AI-2E family transporter [Candidatus Cloacimonadaceae bacterium]